MGGHFLRSAGLAAKESLALEIMHTCTNVKWTRARTLARAHTHTFARDSGCHSTAYGGVGMVDRV